MRKFLISLIVMLSLSGVGVGVFYHFKQQERALQHPTFTQLAGWRVPIKEITTNTQGGGIVQIQLTIQAVGNKSQKQVKTGRAEIRSTIIDVLHATSVHTFKTSNGIRIVRKRIITGVQKLFPHTHVKTVYITHVIAQ